MPIIPIPENTDLDGDERLRMGEPLMWDTETLSGTCAGRVFDRISDVQGVLTALQRQAIQSAPSFFTIYGINNGFYYMRLYNRQTYETFYLKHRDQNIHWQAFVMGMHSRIGVDSPVSILSPDVIQSISRHYFRQN